MRKINLVLSIIAGLLPDCSPAQETKEKIGNAIAQYFELDRENIYAHLDKKTFFVNEAVWFKGLCSIKERSSVY